MIYLISSERKLEGVTCLNSLSSLILSDSLIDCLVYHSSVDEPDTVALHLSTLKGKVSKFLYINKTIDPLLYVIFSGLSSDIYNYEDPLDSIDFLNDLISDYGNSSTSLQQPTKDIATVRKVLDSFLGGSDGKRNDLIARRVTSALENVSKALDMASTSNEQVIATLSNAKVMLDRLKDQYRSVQNDLLEAQEGVIKIEKQYTEEISSLQQSHLDLNTALNDLTSQHKDEIKQKEDIISALESKVKSLEIELQLENTSKSELGRQLEIEQRKNTTSTTYIFPTINVPVSVPCVMYVEVFSQIPYLHTFMTMFQSYLKNLSDRRIISKVLFVYPQLKKYTDKYSNLPTLSLSGMTRIDEILRSDFYVTFQPVKKVLEPFFMQPNVNLYIVVDYLMGEPLLTGSRCIRFGATRGRTVPDKTIPESHYFRSLSGRPDEIKVKHVSNYPKYNATERASKFFEQNEQSFEMIKNILRRDGLC